MAALCSPIKVIMRPLEEALTHKTLEKSFQINEIRCPHSKNGYYTLRIWLQDIKKDCDFLSVIQLVVTKQTG